MSVFKSRFLGSNKTNTVLIIVFAMVLLGTIIAVTFFATDIGSILRGNIIASKSGIPETWEELDPVKGNIKTETKAKVKNGYIEYVTSIRNSERERDLMITRISSFFQDDGKEGFLPFGEENLEFSYNPEDKDSWVTVGISEPSNDEEKGYKLSAVLFVGEQGADNDTIYFRYNVSPTDEGIVSDKITFVTENDDGVSTILASDNAVVDYRKDEASSLNTRTTAEGGSLENGDDSYAEPLGVFSQAPNTSVINAASMGSIAFSQDVAVPIIVISIMAGLAIAGLIVFVTISKREQ